MQPRKPAFWAGSLIAALIAGLLAMFNIQTAQADHVTIPECPSVTQTRTGNQTSAIYTNNSNGTWDLTGAVWDDKVPNPIVYPIRSDSWGTGCVIGGEIPGNIPRHLTRDEWYNHERGDQGLYDNAEGVRLDVSSSGFAVIRDLYVSDVEDGIDTNGASGASRTYVDHVHLENIRDDCVENEDTVHDMYISDSLFDGCFAAFAEKPGSSSSDSGTASGVDLFVEDSLIYVNPQPLGDENDYCNSSKVSQGRCIVDPDGTDWLGNYGFFKISSGAAANMVIKDTIFRIDLPSYSSCAGNRFPTNATFENVTLVWTGPGSWGSAGGCTNDVPSGMTVTTDVSVWNNAKAAWLNEEPVNEAPEVNAGTDQSITLPADADLDGTVTDDGLPTSSSVSTAWTKTSGPGTVTFGDSAATDTTAEFSEAGTYVLRLTASDTALAAFDEVTVTVEAAPPTNQAPTVDVGADQEITLPVNEVELSAVVTDDGLPNPPAVTGIEWYKVSGPNGVVFNPDDMENTTVEFATAGTYVLKAVVSDSVLTDEDEVTITVLDEEPPPNETPVVDAGADLNVELPADATLDGTVTDDGTVTTTWSKVSGPGDVTFGDSAAVDTTAGFSESGTYVLRLHATDGDLSAFDEVTVTVTDAPPPPPEPATELVCPVVEDPEVGETVVCTYQ